MTTFGIIFPSRFTAATIQVNKLKEYTWIGYNQKFDWFYFYLANRKYNKLIWWKKAPKNTQQNTILIKENVTNLEK